jgi:hypothetical protein
MLRAVSLVWLFVTLLVGSPLAMAAEEVLSTDARADAEPQATAPQMPVRQDDSSGTELEPGPDGPERRMLDQIASRYVSRIRALEDLSLQVKGMELVDLQRRIEELKRAQSAEELSARIEFARDGGDERRVEQLERLYVPSTPPVTVPESRPVPADAEDNGTGGER